MQHYESSKIKEWQKVYIWQTFNRKRKLIPGAPTPEDLKIFKKCFLAHIKSIKNPRVFVLGPTPEFRNMALKAGCEVVSCDFSMPSILYTERFVEYEDKNKDIVIKGDWFDVPLCENYFDAVFGDAAINNTVTDRYDELFSRIKKWLKKDSLILIREIIYPDFREPEDPKMIIKFYRQKKMNLRDFYLRMRFWLLKGKTFDEKKKTMSGIRAFAEIKNLYKKGILRKSEFDDLYQFKNPVSHSILRETEWKRIFSKYFKIEFWGQTVSNQYGYFPFRIICGRKSDFN